MRFAFIICAVVAVPPAAWAADIDWRGVTIAYDAATWRAGPHDDSAAIVFTCIAADCLGGPIVIATAQKMPPPSAAAAEPLCLANSGNDHNWRRRLPLANRSHPPAGIAFAAVSRWSGCRAMDTPILEACGAHDGTLYRLTTGLGQGCNHAPEMPVDRFLELVRGINPAK